MGRAGLLDKICDGYAGARTRGGFARFAPLAFRLTLVVLLAALALVAPARAAATPSVTGVSPSTGPAAGGDSVTISGSGFTGATAVNFGSAAASFTVLSDTQITATAPPGSGAVDITVTTPGGTSATGTSDVYKYFPSVTVVSPSAGPTTGGTTVTITGTGFTGATAVNFGSAAASFSVVSDTQITTTAPASAPGVVDVTVTGPAGTGPTSANDQYVYHAPASTGGSSPGANFVATGHDMDLHCSSDGTATGECDYFGRVARFVLNGSTKPLLILDKGMNEAVTAFTGQFPGHAYIEMDPSLPAFAALTAADFEQFGAMIVASDASCGGCDLNPSGGTEDSDAILAQKANIATAFNAGLGILALAGACHGSGTGSSCSNPNRYYEFVPVPLGGAAVSSPFTVTPVGISTFKFPDAATASTDANCCATHNSFSLPGPGSTLQVAETDNTKLAETLVAANASISSGSGGFTGAGPSPPTVAGVIPSSGPTSGGTTVTITGTGFTGATAVNFGPSTSTSFTVDSSGTSITAISPPGAPGTVSVSVTTPGGTSPTAGAGVFTYIAAPTVTGVSPGSGPDSGGTAVTITGTGFTGATAANFGSASATGVNVLDDSTITATAPPGSAGTVDVTVIGPAGTSAATSADSFTYVAASAPSVTTKASATPTSSTAGTLGASVNPNGLATSAHYEYGLDPSLRTTPGPLYDQRTPDQPLGSGTVPVPVAAALTGLIPNALYHARLAATNKDGTTFGPDVTFTTPADPVPTAPVVGKSLDVGPVSGIVFIRPPDGKLLALAADSNPLIKGQGFVPLTEARQIPAGSTIDARAGALRLISATGAQGKAAKTPVRGLRRRPVQGYPGPLWDLQGPDDAAAARRRLPGRPELLQVPGRQSTRRAHNEGKSGSSKPSTPATTTGTSAPKVATAPEPSAAPRGTPPRNAAAPSPSCTAAPSTSSTTPNAPPSPSTPDTATSPEPSTNRPQPAQSRRRGSPARADPGRQSCRPCHR